MAVNYVHLRNPFQFQPSHNHHSPAIIDFPGCKLCVGTTTMHTGYGQGGKATLKVVRPHGFNRPGIQGAGLRPLAGVEGAEPPRKISAILH